MFGSKCFQVNYLWLDIMQLLSAVCEAFLNIENAKDKKSSGDAQ